MKVSHENWWSKWLSRRQLCAKRDVRGDDVVGGELGAKSLSVETETLDVQRRVGDEGDVYDAEGQKQVGVRRSAW